MDTDGIWDVGTGGTLAHWNGTQWQSVNQGLSYQTSIWGASENDIWITQPYGQLMHWDGAEWLNVPSGLSSEATESIRASRGIRFERRLGGGRTRIFRW